MKNTEEVKKQLFLGSHNPSDAEINILKRLLDRMESAGSPILLIQGIIDEAVCASQSRRSFISGLSGHSVCNVIEALAWAFPSHRQSMPSAVRRSLEASDMDRSNGLDIAMLIGLLEAVDLTFPTDDKGEQFKFDQDLSSLLLWCIEERKFMRSPVSVGGLSMGGLLSSAIAGYVGEALGRASRGSTSRCYIIQEIIKEGYRIALVTYNEVEMFRPLYLAEDSLEHLLLSELTVKSFVRKLLISRLAISIGEERSSMSLAPKRNQ